MSNFELLNDTMKQFVANSYLKNSASNFSMTLRDGLNKIKEGKKLTKAQKESLFSCGNLFFQGMKNEKDYLVDNGLVVPVENKADKLFQHKGAMYGVNSKLIPKDNPLEEYYEKNKDLFDLYADLSTLAEELCSGRSGLMKEFFYEKEGSSESDYVFEYTYDGRGDTSDPEHPINKFIRITLKDIRLFEYFDIMALIQKNVRYERDWGREEDTESSVERLNIRDFLNYCSANSLLETVRKNIDEHKKTKNIRKKVRAI